MYCEENFLSSELVIVYMPASAPLLCRIPWQPFSEYLLEAVLIRPDPVMAQYVFVLGHFYLHAPWKSGIVARRSTDLYSRMSFPAPKLTVVVPSIVLQLLSNVSLQDFSVFFSWPEFKIIELNEVTPSLVL